MTGHVRDLEQVALFGTISKDAQKQSFIRDTSKRIDPTVEDDVGSLRQSQFNRKYPRSCKLAALHLLTLMACDEINQPASF